MSVVVAAELYHGAFNSNDRQRSLDNVRRFLTPLNLLPCDEITAERFGLIATDLQRRGLKVPHNDIWIAAQTIQHGFTLLTRNIKHMSMIDGLHWEAW